MNTFLIIVIILVIVIVAIISIYNTLVAKKNQVSNISAGVDTQLKKRYDLIPNLVAAVKEYLIHEKETLQKVTELRNLAMAAKNNGEKFELNNQISKLLGGIFVAVEAYPNLKANENVLHLQRTLTEVEEQLSAARRAYNSSGMDYNNACEMFPTNIVASLFNFKKREFFEASDSEKTTPNVSELFKK